MRAGELNKLLGFLVSSQYQGMEGKLAKKLAKCLERPFCVKYKKPCIYIHVY